MFNVFTGSIVRLLNLIVLSVIALGLIMFSLVIGAQNYQQITRELNGKAGGMSSVAAIALQEPIWNFDNQAMNGVVNALLLDKDIVGIAVLPADEKGDPLRQEYRGSLKGLTREQVQQNADQMGILINQASIAKEDKTIGTVILFTSAARAHEQIKQTELLIGGFAAAFILVMGALFWASARRFVAAPLKSLEKSAGELAQGNLDFPIDTSRRDEIGTLAHRFSDMRDAIRKKIEDLHILNTTGEKLAGIHDQQQALETVLAVMNAQNHLECGSIYLLKDNALSISAFYPASHEASKNEALTPRTFQLGQGIAGQAAKLGKTLFIPDTSQTPDYIDPLGTSPKALLCVPMMDDQHIFGVMNFSGKVGSVTFSAEDEEFALTLARMTVVTTKNIQMLNVIEEQNRTLELKVLERTAQLRQKTNDINSMLQNMQQGIFTITLNGTIHPEYSAFLERILDTTKIAGEHFMQVLFCHASLGSDQINQIETAVLAMLGEDGMMFEFNSHLLIHEFKTTPHNGPQKILEVDWAPILDDNGNVEKLMVTVRDITELRVLQQEAESQRQELEIIGQILAVNRNKFNEFLDSSRHYLTENEQLISATNFKDIDVLATLFRNMHTIKGNARTYGFKYLTDAVHEAEHTYDELRKHKEADWNKPQLLDELHKAERFIQKYQAIYEAKLGRFIDSNKGKTIDETLLQHMQAALTLTPDDNETLKERLHYIATLLSAIDNTTLQQALDGILNSVPKLAEDLGKPEPQVIIDDNGLRLPPSLAPLLKDVFMHLFRNALDHGLEAAAEREAKGKTANGQLRLQAQLDNEHLVLDFSDDGRGLALERIHQKAVAAGILSPNQPVADEQLAELIFHSGLSTANSVSDISGRGVGMDAVRGFVVKKGGNIAIVFPNQDEGQPYRAFLLRLTLPAAGVIKT